MITVADLRSTFVFQDFPADDLARILPMLAEKTFPAGATIIYRGDPGDSMFIILSGTIIATLINDEGVEYTINTLAAGDNFGEMALMTGEPRSANVKSATAVRLAELSQGPFLELISAYPQLADAFFRQLAQRRGKSMVRAHFNNLERTEIIAHLFAQQPPAIDRLVGATRWTEETNAAIERLAGGETNILILGERGTGKDLAARLIHFCGSDSSRPLFHLDCANPPPINRETGVKAVEKDKLLLEIAQESALFGHAADAGGHAGGVRKGYLELAADGAVLLENIEALSSRVQHLLLRYLRDQAPAKARLFATSCVPLATLQSKEVFDPELLLLLLLDGEVLTMKPLRERKKDIPLIAHQLLLDYNSKFSRQVAGFSKEALNSLVDHEWPLNVDEMHQVLERAVLTAADGTITERQLFLNLPAFSATGKFNLLKIPFLRKVANYPLFPTGLRFVTVPFILALIILTLLGPPQQNPANLIVWALWWPFLVFSIVIGARSWCGYCPLPIISDGLNVFRKKYFSLPEAIPRHALWIGLAGFALVLLTEHATHMFSAARATSGLLLAILAGTILTNSLFGKRSWCKHICPLGRMIANSSALSLLELGSNSNVCTSQCQTHDCIREGNCPMGLHPSAAAASKDCILCLSCLKKCNHQSVRIHLRLPWYEFAAKEKRSLAEAFFAVTLTALVLAVKLPAYPPLAHLIEARLWGGAVVADSVLPALVAALFILFAGIASGLFSGGDWRKNFAVAGSAYLFLAFAGLLNIYLHEFVYTGENLLPWIVAMVGLGAVIPSEWITPELGTLKAVIPLLTLLGAGVSAALLVQLSDKNALPRWVRRAHQGLLLVLTLTFLLVL